MAHPSPQAVAALRTQVPTLPGGWAGNSDAQVAALLNAPSVANPDPQGTVPKPYATADLMGLLDTAALTAVRNLPSLARLLSDIDARVTGPLDNWVNLLAGTGAITAAQGQALAGVIHATEPDPSYQSQISWAVATLGRPVDADDVAAARPQGS